MPALLQSPKCITDPSVSNVHLQENSGGGARASLAVNRVLLWTRSGFGSGLTKVRNPQPCARSGSRHRQTNVDTERKLTTSRTLLTAMAGVAVGTAALRDFDGRASLRRVSRAARWRLACLPASSQYRSNPATAAMVPFQRG